ncbi:MAG: Flp family type IVb pilin [OCS116 cluster bacterium]|uniref:Flp family type IVb pilin n=1 Tax=OCS116 cluster bacterium TaxID=2030921 RepID=A0A2A4YXB5_9PROT|nr:Flp family type IVb pilin [OCS116 cluster bacterium]
MKNLATNFINDESGATAIEYGLIAGGIAIAILTAITQLATDIGDMFGRISAKANDAATD